MAVAAIAIVAAVVSVVSAVQQNRSAKKAASAQKEASEISSAQDRNAQSDARRQQIREQRIRVAQVEQSAQNTGVTSSSGEIGSLSALSTNAGSNLAMMSGQGLAAQGIGSANQRAANAQSQGQTWAAVGSISNSIFGMTSGGLVASGSKLFGSQGQTKAAEQTAASINK